MEELLICSQCGKGHYRESEDWVFECTQCDHTITLSDLVLDEGETVAVKHSGLLAVVCL